jgi:hypothetical protein
MTYRRPKSYVLEVMVFWAVENGRVIVEKKSYAEIVTQFFQHIRDKYEDLMDNGSGVPKVKDPMLGNVISTGWERSHFETFMRRIRECARWSEDAAEAEHEEKVALWAKIFGDLWPSEAEVEEEARSLARTHQVGVGVVTSTGVVRKGGSHGVQTPPTRFHGE